MVEDHEHIPEEALPSGPTRLGPIATGRGRSTVRQQRSTCPPTGRLACPLGGYLHRSYRRQTMQVTVSRCFGVGREVTAGFTRERSGVQSLHVHHAQVSDLRKHADSPVRTARSGRVSTLACQPCPFRTAWRPGEALSRLRTRTSNPRPPSCRASCGGRDPTGRLPPANQSSMSAGSPTNGTSTTTSSDGNSTEFEGFPHLDVNTV